ncbi:putative serpin-Z5 [Lolium perenne]|uniref:putative serpin-Z5 n=1 Tax=Lolium perenne TaxID=4522 RepID=UPI0021F64303|nr:putative serpin-Z5 [Lolium perenne]
MQDKMQSANGMQAFALGLNKRLADDAGRSGNLVYSPLSVYAALSLVAAGARERTLNELLGVLGAPSRDVLAEHVRGLVGHVLADQSHAGGPRISFACGVWHDMTMPLRPAYRDAAVQSYKAVTRAVNFRQKPEEAGKQINAWVAASTNNLIPSIFSPGALSPLTDLVLANAIYFKGRWDKPFYKKLTKEDKFHRLDGTDVDVSFMRDFGRQLLACHDGFKVLQLRYERGRPLPAQPAPIYSMCVFLPDARDGLWRLTDKINCDPDFVRKHLPRNDVLVGDFRLPKFKLSFGRDMSGHLRELGLGEAFDEGKADLTGMAEDGARGGRRLALQKVMHKAFIEVNEEGTEAAALTGSLVGCSMYSPPPPPPVDFVADHPFAFFVIEEVSGAILFAGHVVDPSIN